MNFTLKLAPVLELVAVLMPGLGGCRMVHDVFDMVYVPLFGV